MSGDMIYVDIAEHALHIPRTRRTVTHTLFPLQPKRELGLCSGAMVKSGGILNGIKLIENFLRL